MTSWPTPPPPQPTAKHRDRALRKLRSRMARLARLLEFNAPPIVIANEAHLVGECAMLIDPHGFSALQATSAAYNARVGLGLCPIDGCDDEPILDSGLADDYCAQHARDLRDENDEITAELAEDELEAASRVARGLCRDCEEPMLASGDFPEYCRAHAAENSANADENESADASDFLDEIIADGTRKDPEFRQHVADAVRRRRREAEPADAERAELHRELAVSIAEVEACDTDFAATMRRIKGLRARV